jgi:glycopeptide antibiotics resistance protein
MMVRFVLWTAFILFFVLLTKNILFKKNPSYYKRYFNTGYHRYKVQDGWQRANTTPFSTIQLFYNNRRMNAAYRQDNLWGNFLGFIPLGFMLPLLIPRMRNGFVVLVTGFLISLGFETTQLLLGLGIFDVDDLILNTAGCLAGYLLFWVTKSLLSKKALPDIKVDHHASG